VTAYEGLVEALEALLRAIGAPDGPPHELRDAIREVERLAGRLTPTDPPELRHFLERRSYTKALDYLRGAR